MSKTMATVGCRDIVVSLSTTRKLPLLLEDEVNNRREYYKMYYQKNKERIRKLVKAYRLGHKEKISAQRKIYMKRHYEHRPWKLTYKAILDRCCNPNRKTYHRYGGRGIKNFLTLDDLKHLWYRDKAWLLKKPSIDRIGNNGNYTLENCRYIEQSENSKRERG